VTHPTHTAKNVGRGTAYYEAHGSWAQVDDTLRRQAQRRPDEPAPPASFVLADDRGNVVSPAAPYRVNDHIPPDALPHVFDRLYRGDAARPHPGAESGLGLAIARSLVEAHCGTLTATSRGAGLGATFTIVLPRLVTSDARGGA